MGFEFDQMPFYHLLRDDMVVLFDLLADILN